MGRSTFACRRAVAALAAALAAVTGLVLASPAAADNTTVSIDTLRTGWDQNESRLSPSDVASSDFGQLFAAQLDGQVYAQPIIAKSTLLAVTENDKAYGLDPQTGKIRWTRDVGPAWPASTIGCGDLVPNIGVTSTPVYDPGTGTAYFTAKVNDGADASHPHWYLHAIDITTGAERANFPTTIAGTPNNDPSNPFNPYTALQRPGLLLMNGVVYAGFGSHCDHDPYVGYVVGVNASSGRIAAMWSDEAGASKSRAGIWQAGGGLMSDGAGRIFLTTGNGVSPAPGPGTSPPATLAESVVRLTVNGDGTLAAKDFFSPVNNTNLDRDDSDLGSGGPMALPDGYGTAAHPHLMVQVGKDGRVFLLDRDNLGGVGQGAGGTDAALAVAGPYKGVWGHPAFWGGGSGGSVYLVTNGGPLLAFKIGVAGNGLPTLTQTGASSGNWGYTSGSPVVTSTGTTAGSSLVWAVYSSGSNGSGGQLRAYDTDPTNGVLTQRFAAPIGTASKFVVPATDGGRVYVGTRDGVVYGFGRPAAAALTGSPTDFGSVAVGGSATRTVTVTATQTVTVSAVATTAPFSTGAVALPTTLAAGQTLDVPVTFQPTSPGAQSAPLTFTTSAGNFAFDLRGSGTQAGLTASPATLDFGEVPTGGTVTKSVDITNTGTATTTITGGTAPAAPFGAPSLPATGSTLAPGASVSVPITYAPTDPGSYSSTLTVQSSSGNVTVPITGTAVAGAAHLTLTPTVLDFGSVPVGTTVTKTFDITNTGNLLLTLTKAAPPSAPFVVPNPVAEGQQLEPGSVIHQSVSFSPTATGAVQGTYLITGDDGQGQQTVTVKGTGTTAATTLSIPGPAAGGWKRNGSATQSGDTTTLTTATTQQAGDVVDPTAVATPGLHVTFTAQLNGGTAADGLTFTLLDATKSKSTSLGRTGGALGYGSLSGVAIALDTSKNGNDPSANFVGVATGATGSSYSTLTWAATRTLTSSLRTGTHTVDVTVTTTGVSVKIDGGTPLTATVTVPPKALLAFTGATGARTDVHAVSKVAITVPAPQTGALVGVASKCAAVAGGATADGTRAQLATCAAGTAQTWTVSGDGTLRALGKCLTAAGTANSSTVVISTCAAAAAQSWTLRPDGTLLNAASGRCLSVPSGTTADGTGLVVLDCVAGTNQTWTLPSGVGQT